MAEVTPTGLPTVAACIGYIVSCGWRLCSRGRGYYYFRNERSTLRETSFTLAELRQVYRTGW